MIQRKTQTPEYWLDLGLGPNDLEFLHTALLDAGKPLTTLELAELLVGERCRREEAQLRAELARGSVYQPKKTFAVGDKVVFPSLDFRLGEVVELRPGENPEYGEFDVINVDFGPDRRRRNYASRLSAPHKLNQDIPDLAASGDLATPSELLAGSAAGVPEALAQALAARPDFARFEDRWLLRDLLAEVHVGHLNIAEALIEMRGAAAETKELAKEIDLPAEVQPEVTLFSLQSVLAADGRFDQVGAGETRKWYLKRLEPPEALEMPEPLRYESLPFDRSTLPPTLQQMEWELDDEWSEIGSAAPSARATTPSATMLLTYPHMVAGTLPLNRHSRPFFPQGKGDRTMVTLVDGRWGQRFPVWAVHQGRYIAGLRGWYEQHKLPAGAYIVLERRDGSDELLLDFRPRRMRREWTRWAHIVDGRLDIQLRKQEVACEYDELVIIGDDQPAEMARLRSNPVYRDAPVTELVHEVFVDLAGLNQQGTVNACTVYSALNVIRRCPPGPVFQCLVIDPRYLAVGDNNYRLAG